jgi:hypothetical protein
MIVPRGTGDHTSNIMRAKSVLRLINTVSQPAMNAKHTAIYDRSQSEIIKYLAAPAPDVAAAALTCVDTRRKIDTPG